MSVGFSRQEILEWVATGNLPNPGVKPTSPAMQVNSLLLSQGYLYNYLMLLLLLLSHFRRVSLCVIP